MWGATKYNEVLCFAGENYSVLKSYPRNLVGAGQAFCRQAISLFPFGGHKPELAGI